MASAIIKTMKPAAKRNKRLLLKPQLVKDSQEKRGDDLNPNADRCRNIMVLVSSISTEVKAFFTAS